MSSDPVRGTAEAADVRAASESTDVVVVGDGPAGSALAAALAGRDVDVVLAGPDEPWHATYGTWADDLVDSDAVRRHGGVADAVLAELAAQVVPTVRCRTVDEQTIERGYLVVANERLRALLRDGVTHHCASVTGVEDAGRGRWLVRCEDGTIGARLVIDATGWPSRLATDVDPIPVAWQTAYGVVLADPPDGPLGTPTVMDWSPTVGGDQSTRSEVPTFAYAFAVEDGWLVEETVLASRELIEPDMLRPVLARRLGWDVDELDAMAVRVERVAIPMGAPTPGPDRRPVPFGAAASLAHPATGYQLAPALRLAGPFADAIAAALDGASESGVDERALFDQLWTPPRRRTRLLHEFGLDVLLRLDAAATRSFFDTFFSLPTATWSRQMRVDSPPGDIARVMTAMFGAAPWSLRRRLVVGDPRRLAGLLRPSSWRRRVR